VKRGALTAVLVLAACARTSTTSTPSTVASPAVTLAATDAPAPPPARWVGLLGESRLILLLRRERLSGVL